MAWQRAIFFEAVSGMLFAICNREAVSADL
jgi:hypothetical protein